MLETDTNLDDFKDDMIEVTEEELTKLSGAGDGDGDKKKEKTSVENKKTQKTAAEKKQPEKKEASEKQSPAGKIIAALVAIAVIGGLVAIFILTGLKNDLVGKWEYVPANSTTARMVFEFNDDGTMEARSYMNNLLNFYDKGTYTTKSGFLKCTWEGQGEVPEVEYKVEGDKLTFVKKGQVFTRIKEDKSKNASSTDATD